MPLDAIIIAVFFGPLAIGAARASGYEFARGVHWGLDVLGVVTSLVFFAGYTWAVVLIARSI